jgi:xylan 1,4-beta-xylosidase
MNPVGRWGLDVIDHAATGKNACTGGIGAPMDFFGCSWYMRIGRPISFFDQTIALMRERLGKYERFKHTPIVIGEFAVLGDERGHQLYAGETTEWSASFYAALADRVYALDVKQLYEWDHATLGVMHPRGRVIEMLEKMVGGQRLEVNVQGTTVAECGALACRQGNDLLLLAYNHRPDRAQVSEAVHLVVRDKRMAGGAAWRVSEWTIDHEHASWAYAFEADCAAAGLKPLAVAGLYEGSPTRLYGEAGPGAFQKNLAKYAALSVVPETRKNEVIKAGGGAVALDLDMAGHSVRFIRLSPPAR